MTTSSDGDTVYPEKSRKKRLRPLIRRLDYINSMSKPNSFQLEEAASLRWVINILAEDGDYKENENDGYNN